MLKAQKFQNTGPAPPFICSHSSEDAAKPVQHQAAQLSTHPLEMPEKSSEQSQKQCSCEVYVQGWTFSRQQEAVTVCLSELLP